MGNNYKCTKCGTTECKMWKERSSLFLYCALCAGKKESVDVSSINKDGMILKNGELTNQIGYMFPAIPVDEQSTRFYAYSFTPMKKIEEWKKLPSLPQEAASTASN